MAREIKPRDGDIVINLHDTLGVTGLVQATATKQVLAEWRERFDDEVAEFRQASRCESSINFELIYVTPKPGVPKTTLNEGLRACAQTILAGHYTASARHS